MQFYTYLWLREDGSPYYVGKGTIKRAHKKHRAGLVPPSSDRIIVQDWPSEELAFEGERLLIAYYGRIDLGTGCLRNMTDGGDGRAGCSPSPETRCRLRDAQRGSKNGFFGHKHTDETRRKISAAKCGSSAPSPKARRNMSEAQRLVNHTRKRVNDK